MRRLYLVRHGLPDFPCGERMCLGITDIPLCTLGRLQGCLLGRELNEIGINTVFTSRLSRAKATAEYICDTPIVLDGLEEMYAGEWDGLSFSQIKARWPELHARRGLDPNIKIPGAEDVFAGQRRFLAAVSRALEDSCGDIAIVAHSTVSQSFICAALGVSPELGRQYKLPYGSYSVFAYEKLFHLESMGLLPHPTLDRTLCLALLDAADCGDKIKAHCAAVADRALEIAAVLADRGAALDMELIKSAALLHDIARREAAHPAVGALWLRELGYEDIADIIRQHHDIDGPDKINEAAVVYIADKLTAADRRVSLEARFSGSGASCLTPEARAAHETRYAAAKAVKNTINAFCGKEIII